MATLALSAAGAAIGSTIAPAGISALGATISGAAIGRAVGSVAGNIIDNALFGPLASGSGQPRIVEGPRLEGVKISSSTEGSSINRLYGRARLSGQMIWATRFEEEVVTSQSSSAGSGGKGLNSFGASSSAKTVTQIEYRYYGNMAYALCEGEITRIGRIWADGKELDQSQYIIRVYRGTQDQQPDSLLEAKEGAGSVPAYRGIAYVVFERMPLARFGNRMPQLNFEVFRAVDNFEDIVRAVTVIPGAGEFIYEKDEIVKNLGEGVSETENRHSFLGGSDWEVSLDQLQEGLKSVSSVSLIVSWFGDDLRAEQCALRPKVEISDKQTTPDSWAVAGVSRAGAATVSLHEGRPAYGGTPSDKSVISAIQDLKARGMEVLFTPFILMDIAEGNSLPDPYGAMSGQAVYPWRGRITVHPAAGVTGSVDKTAAAATQIAAFLGTAQSSDFSTSGETVIYSGPNEWSYRRMILHYAYLCKAAGGVDAFLIGTELRGLTQVRQDASTYPFVGALIQLADEVRAILGAETKITYAADWSEYFGHHPQDSSQDVYFNLDPLWSSSNIDAIGIDLYWPLSDWRDGQGHLDRQNGVQSIYDLDYLRGNVAGGEGYDWYYASASDRDNQIRTPITDGAGKPWVFRFKDIKSWWENAHYNRPGGIEDLAATDWVPQSKPFWFTEFGCPAIDKGANQPNVFVDPKSSENNSPYYSRRVRDDLIQRRYIEAVNSYFDTQHAGYISGSNPLSSVYGGRMVDIDHAYVYTWDARPYPAFPARLDVWGDGDNWELGHWLNGRVAGGPLSAVIERILDDYDYSRYDASQINGNLEGYVIDRVMSARDAIQTLELAFFFDSYESDGRIRFAHRGQAGALIDLTPSDLVQDKGASKLYELTRGQETELPQSVKLTYIDADADYRVAAVEARRLTVHSARVSTADMAIVLGQAQAQAISETWLQDSWAARERAELTLPPSMLAYEPTDVINLQANGRSYPLRLVRVSDGLAKNISARSIEPDVFASHRAPTRTAALNVVPSFGAPIGIFLDLPLLRGDENPYAGYVGAYMDPWPGSVLFYRSPSSTGFTLNALTTAPATLGVTQSDFYAGPEGRWDYANQLQVKLDYGTLSSADELALLDGGNLAAIENSDGEWEIVQFSEVQLVGDNTYQLSKFLRAQAGTEFAMEAPVPGGARFVLLNSAIVQANMTANEVDLAYNWKFGPSSHEINHQSYQDSQKTFNGAGLRPLSVVHIRGEKQGDDVQINWVRRTRLSGDSWDNLDVPLGEDSELYEVDILDGANVLRTLSSTDSAVTYSEAQQIEDWGGGVSNLTLAIYQVSATYGRGAGRQSSLTFA